MTRYLLIIGSLALASCAGKVRDWDMSDPNRSSRMASDMMEPRHYRSDSIGLERTNMTYREMRELTRKKKTGVEFHGELSVGVGTEF